MPLLRVPATIFSLVFVLSFFSVLSFAIVAPIAHAEPVSIGAHAFWYRGPVRSMALSGATVAETYSGSMLDNPAAMVFQSSLLTGDFCYGQPIDESISTASSVSLSQSFRMIGGTVLPLDFFAMGVTYQTLNFRSINKPDSLRTLTFSDDISELDFASALRIGEYFSIGGAISNADSVREIDLAFSDGLSFSGHSRATGSTTYKAGIQSRFGKVFSLGLFYREPSHFSLANSGELSLEFFDASYHPRVVQAGFVLRPFAMAQKSGPFSLQNLAIAAQVDQYKFTDLPGNGKIYSAPGVVFGAVDAYELNTKDAYIPRIGVELPVVTTWIFSTYTRFGSYYEPAYLKNGRSRYHATVGALVRFWYFAFEGAFDAARSYNNWNYGAGLSFEFD